MKPDTIRRSSFGWCRTDIKYQPQIQRLVLWHLVAAARPLQIWANVHKGLVCFLENNSKWRKKASGRSGAVLLLCARRCSFSGCVACGSAAHETSGGGVEGRKEFFLLQIPFFNPITQIKNRRKPKMTQEAFIIFATFIFFIFHTVSLCIKTSVCVCVCGSQQNPAVWATERPPFSAASVRGNVQGSRLTSQFRLQTRRIHSFLHSELFDFKVKWRVSLSLAGVISSALRRNDSLMPERSF